MTNMRFDKGVNENKGCGETGVPGGATRTSYGSPNRV